MRYGTAVYSRNYEIEQMEETWYVISDLQFIFEYIH